MPFLLSKNCYQIHERNAELMADLQKMQEKELRRSKHLQAREIPTINCDSWMIVRPATEADKRKARSRIINRIKNAFWL